MNHRSISLLIRFCALLATSVLVFWACQLTQNGGSEQKASFTNLYETLSQYDSVVIVFKDRDGRVLDTVYHARVISHADIENLPVKNWDGGSALIDIIGFKDGAAVYKIEKRYDGTMDTTYSTFVIFAPGTALSSPVLELRLIEGDSVSLPEITVKPPSLSDKSLLWNVANPDLLFIGDGYLKALKPGSTKIQVRLKSDTAKSKSISIQVSIATNDKIPGSLSLSADTLFVALNGAPGRLSVVVAPSNASNAVVWSLADSSIAAVSTDGTVRGLKKGKVKLLAASKEKSSIFDTAWVIVSDPIAVESVRFLKDSTSLFIGGAPESLMVEVLPSKANPDVEFSLSDSTKMALKNNRISGLAVGLTSVIVKSKENPSKADTLKVSVLPALHIDGVSITPRSLKLFTGGEGAVLAGKVSPSSVPQQIQWQSANPNIAKVDALGKVTPVAIGITRIFATSLADSIQKDSADVTVKRDMPQVSVGQDTVVSLGQTVTFLPVVAPQEYGIVTQFKWDLDGDLAWDDSSATVKSVSYKYDLEKECQVRFYIRDSEGNDTVVYKKVKAVSGPVIFISFPQKNSYTNQIIINVSWSVNGVEQDSLKKERLKDGANTITRTAKDAAGNPYSYSITVFLDTLAPNKPQVHGPLYATTLTPTWSWATGGSGGSGIYRVAMDAENFSNVSEIKDTSYTPGAGLSESLHTLFVQERDAAGNWSPSGRLTLRVDLTTPSKPDVRVNPAAITNARMPKWSWNGTGGGVGSFQYKVDSPDFSSGAVLTSDTSYSPVAALNSGTHTVYVRERDSTGNWSLPGSASVVIDTVPPGAPKIFGTSPTNNVPKWTWSTGGGGGSGDYRYKLGGDGNPALGGTESRDSVYSLVSAASGNSYTLYIQERDAAGNWSAVASLLIDYDLTKPTVTISLPKDAGVYVDTFTTISLSGLVSGRNTIAKVTYSVDGGGSTNAVMGTMGAWSISNISLPLEKTYVIVVTATDNLGNTGEATLSVLRDNTPPNSPTSLSAPPSPTNNPKASWTWFPGSDGTNGSGLSGQYRYNIGGGAWTITGSASASLLSLNEGSNTFNVQEQDNGGKWSASASNIVVLDTKVPDAVVFSGVDGSYTSLDMPTWSWTPSVTNGGIGTYILKMDAGAEFDLSSTSYTPGSALADNQTHTLIVKQKDQVAGAVGAAKSFSYKVKVNPAGAPSVKSDAGVANNGATNNPKFTWTSAGGGKGVYRVRLNSETSYQTHPQASGIQTEWSVPASMADGSYTIHVSEQDDLGRWGAEGDFTIQLDRTGPNIVVTTKDQITNQPSMVINFTADGVSKSFNCALASDNNQNTCKLSATDGLGNQSQKDLVIWRRSNVIFLKVGGGGDGSSWDQASGDLLGQSGNSGNTGKELWLASGDYGAGTIFPNTTLSLIGGFDASTYPTNKDVRNKTNTYLNAVTLDWQTGGGCTLDGLVFTGTLVVRITTATITDCKFTSKGRMIVTDGGSLTAYNTNLTGVNGYLALIDLESGTLIFNGGTVVNNIPADGGHAFWIRGTSTLKGALNIYGNKSSTAPGQIYVDSGAVLTVEKGVNFDCAEIYNAGGHGSCNGVSF